VQTDPVIVYRQTKASQKKSIVDGLFWEGGKQQELFPTPRPRSKLIESDVGAHRQL
jgi:hypothetical protein